VTARKIDGIHNFTVGLGSSSKPLVSYTEAMRLPADLLAGERFIQTPFDQRPDNGDGNRRSPGAVEPQPKGFDRRDAEAQRGMRSRIGKRIAILQDRRFSPKPCVRHARQRFVVRLSSLSNTHIFASAIPDNRPLRIRSSTPQGVAANRYRVVKWREGCGSWLFWKRRKARG
jgi:hypothetical protein